MFALSRNTFLKPYPKIQVPQDWGCRIHRQQYCRGLKLQSTERASWYDIKQSDWEATEMLLLWGIRSTSSLPSLPGPLWPGVVAPDRTLSMDQIELNCELRLNWITWKITILDIETVYLY